MGDEEEE